MKPKHSEIDGARRGFFRTAAGMGVAAGAGALILRGGTAHAQGATKAPPASVGYRETDHIRKYYETARG
ncbi:MAG: hypothetical protein R3225_00155 [Halofilum sp. (in: g-proteobacteria)]|nr:hypothetical protein [Halofilum sp. (in: g-proteobacteria)]